MTGTFVLGLKRVLAEILNIQGSHRDVKKIQYTGKSMIFSIIEFTGKLQRRSKIEYTGKSIILSNIKYTGK